MNKLIAGLLAVAAICALAVPAGAIAAKPVKYVGKTSGGHNFVVTTKKLRNGTIRGHLRKQYEFLVPKYPIGTFTIYSCLGEATFQAKPAR